MYFIGDTPVPSPGVDGIAEGSTPAGWTLYDFDIPSTMTTLPVGWSAYANDGRTDDEIWNDVIVDVDAVQFFYGDPASVFPFFSWDVGLDNPRVTFEQSDEIPVLVTFDNAEYRGWTILGFDDQVFQPTGGNPDAHLNFFFENFFIRIYDATDPAFTGDYSRKGRVMISADLRWRVVNFFGTNVRRDLFFMIWDEYVDENGVDRKHVLLKPVGKVRGQGPHAPWRTSRVRLPNPDADGLPGGWFYWPFDGSIEPSHTLPVGVTVADIMSSVDRVQWSTATPGQFFGFTTFDVSVDNCSIKTVNGPRPRDNTQASASRSGSAGLGLVEGDTTQLNDDEEPISVWAYLDLWRQGDPMADYTTTGAMPGEWGFGIGDNVVDQADLTYFRNVLSN
ncbi:MAG: hypothetical protein ACI8QZ_000130 [Chlamydiales bacterium]